MLPYFSKIFPIKDAFNGTTQSVFDVCFDNWIGKDDWFKIISEIEQKKKNISGDKKKLPFNVFNTIDCIKHNYQNVYIIGQKSALYFDSIYLYAIMSTSYLF